MLSSPRAHLRITWSALHCYITSHLLCVQQLRSQSVKSVGNGRKKLRFAQRQRIEALDLSEGSALARSEVDEEHATEQK